MLAPATGARLKGPRANGKLNIKQNRLQQPARRAVHTGANGKCPPEIEIKIGINETDSGRTHAQRFTHTL